MCVTCVHYLTPKNKWLLLMGTGFSGVNLLRRVRLGV